MSRWKIIASLAVALISAGLLVAGGATAAKKDKPATFRQVLSAKLGKELDKPAGDVLAALKAAPKRTKAAKPKTKAERQARRAATQKYRADWAAAVGKSLGVDAAKVTAAVNALVKQRLDSLVQDGWLTKQQAAKRQGKLGVGFLRVR